MHGSHRTRRASRGKKRKKSRGGRDDVRMLVGGTKALSEIRLMRLLDISDARLDQQLATILELQVEVALLDMKLKECEEQLATNNQNNDGYKRLG